MKASMDLNNEAYASRVHVNFYIFFSLSSAGPWK